MKKLLLTLAIIVVFTSSLIAQPMRNGKQNRENKPEPGRNARPEPGKNVKPEDKKAPEKMDKELEQRRQHMMKEMIKIIAKKYNLTEEQTKKLEQTFAELMKNQAKLMDEMKKEMEELRKKHEQELKELLGDKYDDFKKEMNKRQKANEPWKRNERPMRLTPAKIAELLKLSEEQTKSFTELFDKTLKKFQDMRGEAFKEKADADKMREKFVEIIKEFEVELKKLLTEEQWKNYSKMKNDIFPMLAPKRNTDRGFKFQVPDYNAIAKELGLSETQKESVKKAADKVSKEYRKLMQAISNRKIQGKEVAEKVKKITDDFEAEMKKILTEDQMKKYQELKKKAASKRSDRPQDRQRFFGVDRMIKALDLNEEQQTAIKQFLADFKKETEKLQEERGNPEKMREKIKALVDELNKKVRSQLNDEQKKKFDEMIEKMQQNRENRNPERPERPGNQGRHNGENKPDRPGNPERPDMPMRPESPALPR